MEASDILSLSDPKTHIIDKGGFIYYASLNGEMIGTASLLKKSKDVFELGIMAVSSKAHSLGVKLSLEKLLINFDHFYRFV